MAVTLMLFALSAFAMDAIGIHAVFGGFLLGAVMPRGLFAEQVRKQLAKLVPVVKVRDFKDAAYVERDLLLVKVGANAEKRGEVIEIVNMFRGNVVDVAIDSLMIELIGTEEKLEAFLELMKVYGIEETARTGVIAMARGAQSSKEKLTTPAGKKRTRSLDAPAAAALPPS